MRMLGYLGDIPTLDSVDNVVVVHYPCHDGFTAAWVASLHLPVGKTLFLAANYGKDPLTDQQIAERFGGRDVFILDFSYDLDVLMKIARVAKSVVVCDHHQTFYQKLVHAATKQQDEYRLHEAITGQRFERDEHFVMAGPQFKAVLTGVTKAGAVTIYYSNDMCGSEIAYRYFHSECAAEDTPSADWESKDLVLPMLICYVGDRDLWLWKMRESAEFSAALGMEPHTFDRWTKIHQGLAGGSRELFETGKTVLAYEKMRIEQICRNAYTKEFNLDGQTHRVPVANTALLISEVGHRLCELYPDAPFAGIYFENSPGEQKWSLRGRDSDDFDVSEVAKAFGGGGHKKAAGFILPRI